MRYHIAVLTCFLSISCYPIEDIEEPTSPPKQQPNYNQTNNNQKQPTYNQTNTNQKQPTYNQTNTNQKTTTNNNQTYPNQKQPTYTNQPKPVYPPPKQNPPTPTQTTVVQQEEWFKVKETYFKLGEFTQKSGIPVEAAELMKTSMRKQFVSSAEKITSLPSGKTAIVLSGTVKKFDPSTASTMTHIEVDMLATRNDSMVFIVNKEGKIGSTGTSSTEFEKSKCKDLMDALASAVYQDIAQASAKWK